MSHPWIKYRKSPRVIDDPYKHLYHSPRWRRSRAIFLQNNPLCCECEKESRVEQATVVDHRIPVRSGKVDFWDETNWQALCETHHNQKRNHERGTINYTNQYEG